MMNRFFFTALGTAGDVLPLVAVAAELVRRGHVCQLLANEPFESLAVAQGIEFAAIAPTQQNNITSVEHNFGTYLFPSYEPTFAYFASRARAGDVIVNLDPYSASNSMAELFDLRICRLHLAPFKIRSLVDPFWPLKKQAQGPFGQTFLKYTLPQIYETWDRYPFVVQQLNRHRKTWGLAAVDSVRHSDARVAGQLALFPRWYREPAPDWPADLEYVGFPLPKSRATLPHELERFIAAHGPPVVFTPGTGVPDVAAFFTHARDACESVGLSAVFLSPYADRARDADGSRILQLDYVDLELVLPRAALLVHHGGIGTTARALQAGIPQIISPLAYDQPDNGYRITQLGVGKTIERSELCGESLAHAVSELTSDGAVRARLGALRERLVASDAIARAADHLERLSEQSEISLRALNSVERPATRAAV